MPLTSQGVPVTGGAGPAAASREGAVGTAGTVGRALAAPLVLLVRLYQRLISPMRPQTCRFYPSCSAYAVESLERFGPLKGGWLAARRLGRCHPWTPGGVDPVPMTWSERNAWRPEDFRPSDLAADLAAGSGGDADVSVGDAAEPTSEGSAERVSDCERTETSVPTAGARTLPHHPA